MRDRSALAIAVTLGAVFGLHRIVCPDVFFQVVVGRTLLAHPSTIGVSSFIEGFPSFPYVEHEWLSSVLVALFDKAWGADGLMLFQILLPALAAGVWFLLFRLVAGSPTAGLAGTALCLVATAVRLEPRPDLLSQILFAALGALLLSGVTARRLVWTVPALMLLWVNLHGYFFLGLFLLAAALGSALLGDATTAFSIGRVRAPDSRALLTTGAAVLALSLAACCLHPQGLRATLWPLFQTVALGDPLLRSVVGEISPLHRLFGGMGAVRWTLLAVTPLAALGVPWIRPGTGGPWIRALVSLAFALPWLIAPPEGLLPWPYRLAVALLAASLFEIIASVRERRLFLPIVLAGVTAMAVPLLRNLSYVPPVSLALLLPAWARLGTDLRRRGGSRLSAAGSGLVLVIVALAAWARLSDRIPPGGQYVAPGLTGWGVDGERFPVSALSFLREQRLPGPLLNDYDGGGYDLYRLYPDWKPFIAGHTSWYPPAFLRTYAEDVMSGANDAESLHERFGVRTVVFGLASTYMPPLIRGLAASPSWALAYLDRSGVIFVHVDEVTLPTLARLRLDLGRTAAQVIEQTPLTRPALPGWLAPQTRASSHLEFAIFLRDAGQARLALRDANRLWALNPTIDTTLFLAETTEQEGTLDEEVDRLESAVRLFPRSGDVSRWLARALFCRADKRLTGKSAGVAADDVNASRADLKRSLSLAPGELGPLLTLAHLEVMSGNPAEAKRLLTLALERFPEESVSAPALRDPLLAPLLP